MKFIHASILLLTSVLSLTATASYFGPMGIHAVPGVTDQ